jgi:hypothetical protein
MPAFWKGSFVTDLLLSIKRNKWPRSAPALIRSDTENAHSSGETEISPLVL